MFLLIKSMCLYRNQSEVELPVQQMVLMIYSFINLINRFSDLILIFPCRGTFTQGGYLTYSQMKIAHLKGAT